MISTTALTNIIATKRKRNLAILSELETLHSRASTHLNIELKCKVLDFHKNKSGSVTNPSVGRADSDISITEALSIIGDLRSEHATLLEALQQGYELNEMADHLVAMGNADRKFAKLCFDIAGREPKYLEEQPDFGGSESLSRPGDH